MPTFVVKQGKPPAPEKNHWGGLAELEAMAKTLSGDQYIVVDASEYSSPHSCYGSVRSRLINNRRLGLKVTLDSGRGVVYVQKRGAY